MWLWAALMNYSSIKGSSPKKINEHFARLINLWFTAVYMFQNITQPVQVLIETLQVFKIPLEILRGAKTARGELRGISAQCFHSFLSTSYTLKQ